VRPINLIPEDQRRARDGASRTGPVAYIVVGALVVLLAGVAMLVVSSNQISERKAEVSGLSRSKEVASAQVARLAPYANFKLVADQRTQTIVSLADSRFDWPRVIRQVSLVIPPHVWLTELSGSAGGGSGGEGESAVAGVVGPSLLFSGCAPAQTAVAELVAALKVIDGVTRVVLEHSISSEDASGSGGEGSASGGEGDCGPKGRFGFKAAVAFDAAPPSPDNGGIAIEEASVEEPASSTEPPATEKPGTSASTEPTPAG
jgi:Tfp pilus assembly protein PilN